MSATRKRGERWEVLAQADGSVRMLRRPGAVDLLFLLVWNVVWNGLTGMFTAIGLGWDFPGDYSGPRPGSVLFWLFLSPFQLVGGLSLWALIYTLGSVEWRVRSNELVVTWRLLGLRFSRRYSDAMLILDRMPTEDEPKPYLKIQVAGKKRNLCFDPDAEKLAALVAGRAGWTVLPAGG